MTDVADAGGASSPLPHDTASSSATDGCAEPTVASGTLARPFWRAWRGHRWFAASVLAMLVASDYKFRVRDPSQTFQDKADIAVIIEIAAYGSVLLYLFFSRPPPRLRLQRMPMPMVAAFALVAVMVLSLPRSDHIPVEMVRATQMVVILSVVTALYRRGSRSDVHAFLHGFLVLVAGSVIFGIVYPMPRFASQPDRFTWLRIHPVTSAVFVAAATLIAAGYLLLHQEDRPGPVWPRWAYGGLGLIVAGGLYATKTRGAVLGTILGIIVLAWFVSRGRQRVELFVLSVVGLVGFALAASSQILSYIQRGESVEQLQSLNSRTGLWDIAWSFIREKPLFGYGIGASHSLFLDSTGLGGAHNALVNVLCDLGMIGTIVWMWLIGATIAQAVRARSTQPGVRLERALILALMTMLLINGVSNGGLGDEANVASTLLFVLAAWSCVLSRQDVAIVRGRPAAAPPPPRHQR